jgi:2-keto-4-pentenoate hydratase/2-oxohepta-3-ene-1,7-dioic acid hydratase in catechol pathway
MKLVTFRNGGPPRLGVVAGDEVVDLREADPALPAEMTAFLAAGAPALAAARRAADTARRRLSLASVILAAPVLRPPKFLGVGLNYAEHVRESGAKPPEVPIIFTKQSTCVIGPRDPIHVPRASAVVDYEGELAFVIGRRCRHVPKARAREVIAGYTVCNDVSVRDWQRRSPTMMMGKSFDTHGPLGPWLTTADEIDDPHALPLRTWVSGDLRQDSNTKEMIFDCFDLVEHLSTAFTLEPGDVVTTGTPSGVGIAMKPPKLLAAGDVVRIEIEGIGALENPVIAEPSGTVRL